MIDMRNIYFDDNFNKALSIFNSKLTKKPTESSECDWSLFKESFLEFTQYKCPICEDRVKRYDDIDHFRPKGEKKILLYPFLKCCYQNYMVMCSECNRFYKKAQFPLYDEFKADKVEDIIHEKPLLVNPTHDDIFELFELEFKIINKTNKGALVIKPKDGLDHYQQQKAMTTIKLYGIGSCDENNLIDNCRIDLLELHYEQFYQLAIVFKKYFKEKSNNRNKIKIKKMLDNKPKLKKYGFYQFIIKNQFTLAI